LNDVGGNRFEGTDLAF